ncbi:TetR/AcrR family transcriptional regulator [Couchioplanes caeruleus]|uniref:TetR family transcriptional regulator n=2 Tax=Couchioplanes caeruleus TaxID=56438 RepID=A0A1K0FED4_9ACTN|nr:TetR/AcrR family transcriptional regulator [Couchioplanes caeruleus]OJF11185.1 TetR family transcriptional regulator [Couchioplanes caeruleus subsp. caeruleus]ROP30871.1 TetR family transcriptional regulator [Couchioplanes caeruleus]
MPRLWNDTIAAHRQTVRDATLDAAEALVAERGLASVTMSQIAQTTGIGRATLYKYFPDVDAVLLAWHERQVHRHLHSLTQAGDGGADPAGRLRAVLQTYAGIRHRQPAGELAAGLHRGAHVAHAHQHLRDFVTSLIRDAAAAGDVRSDIAPDELAAYCLHALGAAAGLSDAAVARLVAVTYDGLRA